MTRARVFRIGPAEIARTVYRIFLLLPSEATSRASAAAALQAHEYTRLSPPSHPVPGARKSAASPSLRTVGRPHRCGRNVSETVAAHLTGSFDRAPPPPPPTSTTSRLRAPGAKRTQRLPARPARTRALRVHARRTNKITTRVFARPVADCRAHIARNRAHGSRWYARAQRRLK